MAQTYSVIDPITASEIFQDTTSSITTKTSSSSSKSTRSTSSKQSSQTKSDSTSSLGPLPTSAFKFIELFDRSNLYPVPEDQFLSAAFSDLCPSQNCVQDCGNLSHLFEAPLEIVNVTSNEVPVTLFGICSNLANATNSAFTSGSDEVKSFFEAPSSELSSNISLLTTGIATCFSNTCDKTRDPSQCSNFCTPKTLLDSPTSFDFRYGAINCVNQLCSNTCGLPYADQDVFGVGVLVSYALQGGLLLALGAAILASTIWQSWRLDQKPRVKKQWKQPLESFLTAQSYFGISAAIASFVMQPATVDPLNGYALISVSLMGCIGPVFTLALLHSHGMRSWFGTGVCFVTWLLNTVVFFILLQNLLGTMDNAAAYDHALKELFEVSACGGSSAMSLCQQLTGTNPLLYLTGFYNQGSIPNVHTVPILWAYATLVFVVLMISQLTRLTKDRGVSARTFFVKTPPPVRKVAVPGALAMLLHRWTFRFTVLLLTTILFSLSLGYQYVMVRSYMQMDVIDKNGWSFGQVVAVLFWAPPFLDVIHSYFGNKKPKPPVPLVRIGEMNEGQNSYEMYRPLAHSPAPSPGPYESGENTKPADYLPPSGDTSEMHTLQQRRTLRMEEGQ